jgi:type I restriction enzyme M protein
MKDLEEQDFSLNPGRYVGVVIEEDGKTEQEFIDEMLTIHNELDMLNKDSDTLENVIAKNLKQMAGDV